jgi:hypothetical protein
MNLVCEMPMLEKYVSNALNSLSWVLNHFMMFTNERSHIWKWTHGLVVLT